MKIQTRYYGEQEIRAEDIVRFPDGLPGFPDTKRFVFQPFGEAFSVLQSVDQSNIAFIVTSPFLLSEQYSVNLPDVFVSRLEIQAEEDVGVWVIVSVRDPFATSTVNMKAPIIINQKTKTGRQYIPDQSPYSLREPLIAEKQGKRA